MAKAHEKSRTTRKIAFEEKGQRTTRSTDVYIPKEGLKEVSFCTKCGILYRNKRWYIDEQEQEAVRKDPHAHGLVCPACQRVEDNNPAGIVTLTGDYLSGHEREILDLVTNRETHHRAKNPLARIMSLNKNDGEVVISTTEEKLAEALGREMYKAHKGELHYRWSHSDRFVRVNWSR
jgi:NMD protein affecting ribosome stability and mRNA decay